MASLFSVQTGSVALTASATKSMWLLSFVTNKAAIVGWGLSFDEATPGIAIRWDLYRVTTLGAPAGTAGTVVKYDPDTQVATTTALTALTTEPTTVEILESGFLTQYNGIYGIQYPLGREPTGDAANTTNRIGLRCVTPAGIDPNAVSFVNFEE